MTIYFAHNSCPECEMTVQVTDESCRHCGAMLTPASPEALAALDKLAEAAVEKHRSQLCICGHQRRIHDPEDKHCDAHAIEGFGRCKCERFRAAESSHPKQDKP